MDSEIKQFQSMLADIIDSVVATDRQLNSLAASLLAMRAAFQEIDKNGQFEQIYAKQCAVAIAELSKRSSARSADSLLALAQRLRGQS